MTTELAPSIGRILVYHCPTHRFIHNQVDRTFDLVEDEGKKLFWKQDNNGTLECPAIVVRVWSPTYVNVRLIMDGHSMPWKTSVNLVYPDQEPTPNDLVNGYVTWPERV